jgi:hypothetical protein
MCSLFNYTFTSCGQDFSLLPDPLNLYTTDYYLFKCFIFIPGSSVDLEISYHLCAAPLPIDILTLFTAFYSSSRLLYRLYTGIFFVWLKITRLGSITEICMHFFWSVRSGLSPNRECRNFCCTRSVTCDPSRKVSHRLAAFIRNQSYTNCPCAASARYSPNRQLSDKTIQLIYHFVCSDDSDLSSTAPCAQIREMAFSSGTAESAPVLSAISVMEDL